MYNIIKQHGKNIVIISLIFVVLLSFAAAMILGRKGDYDSVIKEENVTLYDESLLAFDHSWEIQVANEIIEENIPFPGILSCEKNQIIHMTSVLPKSIVEGTYLRLESVKSYVQVYIEGELIYSGGSMSLGSRGEKRMPVDRWNFVPLHPDYSEKEITVTYRSPYGFFSGILPEITLGSYSECLLYTYASGNVYIYLGICIMAVGVIMLLIALIHTLGNNILRPYVYLGIFIILMGMMFIAQANVPRISVEEYYQDFVLENVTFRLAIVWFAIYAGSKWKGKWKWKAMDMAMVLAACALFVAGVAFHFTGKADFNETLLFPVILFLILGFRCLWKEIRSFGGSMGHYRILAGLGTGILAVTFLIGLIEKVHYFVLGFDNMFIIAVLSYSIAMCVALIMNSYDLAMEQIHTAEELSRTKIRLMVSQIQPHFIHNTLNTMRAMVLIEPKRAADLILHFSNYLRYNLNSLDGKDRISFEEEIRHIKEYTAIQCERFHKIRVEYEIEETDFYVPPLAIQVFVENAIKHGVCKKEGGGTVIVTSKKENNTFVVAIVDDGVGFDSSILSEGNPDLGIGIKNAMYRLKELANGKVDIKSEPGDGCQVRIIFPEGKEERI